MIQEVRDQVKEDTLDSLFSEDDKDMVRDHIVRFIAEGVEANADILLRLIIFFYRDHVPCLKGLNGDIKKFVRTNNPWNIACLQFIKETLKDKPKLDSDVSK